MCVCVCVRYYLLPEIQIRFKHYNFMCCIHPKIFGSGSSLRRCYSFASQRIRTNGAHSSHLINQQKEEAEEAVPFFLKCKEKRAGG